MKGRAKWLVAGGSLIVLALAVCLSLWLAKENAKRKAPRLWEVAFSPDGKIAVTAGAQGPPRVAPRYGELVFWDAATGRPIRVVRTDWGLRGLAFAPNGQFIMTGNAEGHTTQVDPANGRAMGTWTRHFGVINSVAVSADSQWVAAGSFDSTVSLWNSKGQEQKTMAVPDGMVDIVTFSPDARWLAAGTRTGKVDVFDLAHDSQPRALEAVPSSAPGQGNSGGNVDAIIFSLDGRSLITSCATNVRVWDTSDFHLARELPGCASFVTGLAFSPDGETLAVTDGSGMLSLWKWDTGESFKTVEAHAGPCYGLAYSSDGKRIATCGVDDGCLRIWDAATLQRLAGGKR
jgi:WD40 repeat protein